MPKYICRANHRALKIKAKVNTPPISDSQLTPKMRKLTVSLSPWEFDGNTYRVIGTRTHETKEIEDPATGEVIAIFKQDHSHKVLKESTGDTWWIPHDRVRSQQEKAGII